MISRNPMLDAVFAGFSTIAPFLIGVLAFGLVINILAKVLAINFQPKFAAQPILNKTEQRLFNILQQVKPDNQRLFAQVSYGEFLKCASNRKFWTVNAKRADFVLCNEAFDVVAVIEYQGSGHYGSSPKGLVSSINRDNAKRKALSEAGIPMIEIPAKFDLDLVDRMINFRSHATPSADPVRIEPTFSDKARADDSGKAFPRVPL